MASARILEITDDSFERQVLRSELPVLLEFGAVWCGPCKQTAPILDELAEAHGATLVVGKVDVDRDPIVTYSLGVTSVPAQFLFKGGKRVWSHVGALTRAEFESAVSPHL